MGINFSTSLLDNYNPDKHLLRIKTEKTESGAVKKKIIDIENKNNPITFLSRYIFSRSSYNKAKIEEAVKEAKLTDAEKMKLGDRIRNFKPGASPIVQALSEKVFPTTFRDEEEFAKETTTIHEKPKDEVRKDKSYPSDISNIEEETETSTDLEEEIPEQTETPATTKISQSEEVTDPQVLRIQKVRVQAAIRQTSEQIQNKLTNLSDALGEEIKTKPTRPFAEFIADYKKQFPYDALGLKILGDIKTPGTFIYENLPKEQSQSDQVRKTQVSNIAQAITSLGLFI